MQNNDKNQSTYYTYTDPLNREITLIKETNHFTLLRRSAFKEPYAFCENSLNIAVLGDLHGHITLALKKILKWTELSGHKIDAILQVGDIGAIDYTSSINKVTQEMIDKDPEELGFRNYFYGSEEAEEFFGPKGYLKNVPLLYIDGNHDDINFLSSISQGENKPKYENLQQIKNGTKVTISNSFESATVAAIGWHGQKQAIKQLEGNSIDILLSHTNIVNDFYHHDPNISMIDFKYHFFGHHRNPPMSSSISQNSYGLSEVKPKKQKDGSIGILYWKNKQGTFLYLPEHLINAI